MGRPARQKTKAGSRLRADVECTLQAASYQGNFQLATRRLLYPSLMSTHGSWVITTSLTLLLVLELRAARSASGDVSLVGDTRSWVACQKTTNDLPTLIYGLACDSNQYLWLHRPMWGNSVIWEIRYAPIRRGGVPASPKFIGPLTTPIGLRRPNLVWWLVTQWRVFIGSVTVPSQGAGARRPPILTSYRS